MKNLLVAAVAASVLAAAAPAVAQDWRSINSRQAMLDQRIDVGVRNGSLTRNEAVRLRAEFRDIAALEARYRNNGLSFSERADLDRRFDRLSAQIRYERNDRQDRGDWQPINARQAQINARINAGLRDRSLSDREADRLRYEFRVIADRERDYRRGGLTAAERRDLDRRFDRLGAMIQAERRDNNNRFG
jgi:hypothetical protein